MLTVHPPGAVVVVEERWRGLPWAAEPHRVVVSTTELLVTWMPAGTVAARASNRDLPAARGLSREQRKLTALDDCRVARIETVEWPDKLHLWQWGRWSRVNLGWDPATGVFLGWYVNFEQPALPTPQGIWGKDLVLDLVVLPDGTTTVKDADDFDEAIARGILAPELRDLFADETARVMSELETGTAAFAPHWQEYRPDPGWATPWLPPSHEVEGAFWSLTGSTSAGPGPDAADRC